MADHTHREIGLGTMGNWGPEKCIRSVEYAIEYGYRYIDSAQIYGNEKEIGAGIKRADVPREEVVLATKISWENLAYDDVFDSFAASLARLDVDYVDHLYVHRPIEAYNPEGTFRAFNELYEEGKIGAIGVSNFSIEELEQAIELAEAPLVGNQVEMHPLYQQKEMREFLTGNDLKLFAYSPLAHGYVPWVDELRWVADENDITPAQAAISWLTSKRGVVPIPMGETPRQIRENFDATSIQLSKEYVNRIDEIDREEKMIAPPAD